MDWDAPIPLVILDEFLAAGEWAALLDYTLSRCDEFTHTGVIDQAGSSIVDREFRRSRALFELDRYRPLFVERIYAHLPRVLGQLGIPELEVAEVETQLTATNDGEFFRAHNDNRADQVNSRALTFVYYFHREPKAFVGGELRVFSAQENETESLAGPYRIAYPFQNQIAFFPSGALHEILPVECPSGDFADSRFTVNGWLLRP